MPAGLPLILELQVSSQTPTKTCWYYQNFEINSTNNILIEKFNEHSSRLIFKNPLEGVYKVIVTNKFGLANFETNVLVEDSINNQG